MKSQISASKKYNIIRECSWRCWYCGCELTQDLAQIHIDHVTPRSRGGTHSVDNLVASCSYCNRAKRNKDLEEFRAYAFRIMFAFTESQILLLSSQGLDAGMILIEIWDNFRFWGERTNFGTLPDVDGIHWSARQR